MAKRSDGLIPIGDILTPKILRAIKRSAGPTPIEKRLIDGAVYQMENPDEAQSLVFQHTVLCQTCLPFRDPGDEARTWERLNGNVHLKVLAGEAMHPVQSRFVPVGLPFGPKARM